MNHFSENPYESPPILAELNEPRPAPSSPPRKSAAVPAICGFVLFISLWFMIGGIGFIAEVGDCFIIGVAMVLFSGVAILFSTIAIVHWMVTAS